VAFSMNGKYGVLEYMRKRIEQNGICVVVVAEGAGQVYFYFAIINHYIQNSYYNDVNSFRISMK